MKTEVTTHHISFLRVQLEACWAPNPRPALYLVPSESEYPLHGPTAVYSWLLSLSLQGTSVSHQRIQHQLSTRGFAFTKDFYSDMGRSRTILCAPEMRLTGFMPGLLSLRASFYLALLPSSSICTTCNRIVTSRSKGISAINKMILFFM